MGGLGGGGRGSGGGRAGRVESRPFSSRIQSIRPHRFSLGENPFRPGRPARTFGASRKFGAHGGRLGDSRRRLRRRRRFSFRPLGSGSRARASPAPSANRRRRLLFFGRKWARPALRARARWIGAGGPAQPSPAGGGEGFGMGGRGRRGCVTPRFDTVARPSEWRARMRKARKGQGGFGSTRVGRERAAPGCK